MNFYIWYGSGVLILLVAMFQSIVREDGIQKALKEFNYLFVRNGDMFSTGLLLVIALFGPLLLVVIAYFLWHNWRNGFVEYD